MNGNPLRIYQIARKIRIASNTIIEYLESLGYELLRKQMEPVSIDLFGDILKRFDEEAHSRFAVIVSSLQSQKPEPRDFPSFEDLPPDLSFAPQSPPRNIPESVAPPAPRRRGRIPGAPKKTTYIRKEKPYRIFINVAPRKPEPQPEPVLEVASVEESAPIEKLAPVEALTPELPEFSGVQPVPLTNIDLELLEKVFNMSDAEKVGTLNYLKRID